MKKREDDSEMKYKIIDSCDINYIKLLDCKHALINFDYKSPYNNADSECDGYAAAVAPYHSLEEHCGIYFFDYELYTMIFFF
jgi:hypothetical protein